MSKENVATETRKKPELNLEDDFGTDDLSVIKENAPLTLASEAQKPMYSLANGNTLLFVETLDGTWKEKFLEELTSEEMLSWVRTTQQGQYLGTIIEDSATKTGKSLTDLLSTARYRTEFFNLIVRGMNQNFLCETISNKNRLSA